MVNSGIEEMVSQLRAVAAQAAASDTAPPQGGQAGDFTALLQAALSEVNTAQQDARNLSQQFELGESAANLQDVVISLQKASLSFQTMVQVRNKLVSAYQEIMNMQV